MRIKKNGEEYNIWVDTRIGVLYITSGEKGFKKYHNPEVIKKGISAKDVKEFFLNLKETDE